MNETVLTRIASVWGARSGGEPRPADPQSDRIMAEYHRRRAAAMTGQHRVTGKSKPPRSATEQVAILTAAIRRERGCSIAAARREIFATYPSLRESYVREFNRR